jgi:hypothetical protein
MNIDNHTPHGMDLAMKLPGRIFTISILITTAFLIVFICCPYNEFIAQAFFYTAFSALSINCIAFVLLLIYVIVYREHFLNIMQRALILLLIIPFMVIYMAVALSNLLIDYHG